MDKKNRILSILYKLFFGSEITVSGLAEEYHVSEKSILRDISMIRSFLAENRNLVGNIELEYDRKRKVYKLSRIDGIQARELLIILKIVLGSRVFKKEELRELIGKLTVYSSCTERRMFQDFWKNEMEYYCQASEKENFYLYELVWELEKWIKEGKSIEVIYKKLNGKKVERRLYPIAVAFSGFYFYLLACRGDIENSAVIYYRIDRIEQIRKKEEKVPIEIEEKRHLERARLYNQKMFMGEYMKIRFVYTGPSVEAILDKFPTADIVSQDEERTEITAMVEYSRGTIMELLSQGNWVKVLGPEKLLNDMRAEVHAMEQMYEE